MDSNGQIFNNRLTILFIIICICNPIVRVGVESLKKKIESARLPTFYYDVLCCMDDIVMNYNLIIKQEKTHDNIIHNILIYFYPHLTRNFLPTLVYKS